MSTMQHGSRPSFGAAMEIIAERSILVEPELIPLADALGACLAKTVHSRSDWPRFHTSAMDGFAIRVADSISATLAAPINLTLAPPIHAGDRPFPVSGPQATPIGTGAMLPSGCDAVITREEAELWTNDGQACVRLDAPVRADLNVRKRGEDAVAGEAVAQAGDPVTPATIGALSSYGVQFLIVRRPPAIAILPTGSELRTGGDLPLEPNEIYDSNGPMIEAFARRLNLEVHRSRPIGDNLSRLQTSMDSILDHSQPRILISTGGVSVGDRDLVRAILLDRGADIHFHGVSMRPGKPVLFATLPNGSLYFGLPGNPVAALLGFRFFVIGALRAMIGRPAESGEFVDFTTSVARSGTTIFSKVRVGRDRAGHRSIDMLPFQQSHMMRPLLTANAWLRTEALAGRSSSYLYAAFPDLMD